MWLRRDLRLEDNVALAGASAQSDEVACVFVLDPELLRGPRVGAPIVQFFFSALDGLRADLREHGSDLVLLEGDFAAELVRFARHIGARAVFYNHDYDPATIERDERVETALRAAGIEPVSSLDHVIAGADEVLQDDGRPYSVFTPYSRKWMQRTGGGGDRRPVASREPALRKLLAAQTIGATREVPAPEAYGHQTSDRFPIGDERSARTALASFIASKGGAYDGQRDFPAIDGTSHLSPHLRAGTIGIRTCVSAAFDAQRTAPKRAAENLGVWIGELCWRDFYQQILKNVPRVAYRPYREDSQHIVWRDDEAGWNAWAQGKTGYPIVDAAMVQINTYGWMHNRLRMIVASFLTKDLLIDYHEGERYFEQHLADGDLAQNNGGWQWSASTGNDAAPYFRVFNPTLQGKKFDPDATFIRAMIPALRSVPDAYVHEPWTMPPLVAAAARCEIGNDYPAPIVDHAQARVRAIETFGRVFGRANEPKRVAGRR